MASFVPDTFADGPAGNTPITAAKLNNAEQGIVQDDITNSASNAAVLLASDLAAKEGTAALDTDVAGLINGSSNIRTALEQRSPYVNVKDYGAKGDGFTDDTAAIQAAINVLTNGGQVYFPHGAYIVSSTLNVLAGVALRGESAYASTLTMNSATLDMITLNTSSGLDFMHLTSNVSRTAGRMVNMQASGTFVMNTTITSYYVGIQIGTVNTTTATGVVLSNVGMFSPSVVDALSGAVDAQYFGDLNVRNVNVSGPTSGNQPAYGFRIQQGDTMVMSDSNITLHRCALSVVTPTPHSVDALKFVNCLFDSAGTLTSAATVNDVYFFHSGYVYDVQFTNCWFGLSSTQSGCFLYPQGTGALDGIQFSNCTFHHNGHSGLRVQGPLVKHLVVTGCQAGGNTNYGIAVGNGSTLFTLNGNQLGPIANNAGNGIGINLDATANTQYVITNNISLGNVTSQLYDGSTGTPDRVVANNITA